MYVCYIICLKPTDTNGIRFISRYSRSTLPVFSISSSLCLRIRKIAKVTSCRRGCSRLKYLEPCVGEPVESKVVSNEKSKIQHESSTRTLARVCSSGRSLACLALLRLPVSLLVHAMRSDATRHDGLTVGTTGVKRVKNQNVLGYCTPYG